MGSPRERAPGSPTAALVAMTIAAACAGADGVSSSNGTGLASSMSEAATSLSTSSPDEGTDEATGSDDGSGDASTMGETSTTEPASTSGPCEEVTWYRDVDGDGRGDAAMTTLACEPPVGYVAFGDDCDDADAARAPGADEVCDAVDNDCDAAIDEASDTNASCNGCMLVAMPTRSYAFCPQGATWNDGRTACAAFGGDLLRLDDAAENAAVAAVVEPPSAVGGGWFVGLSDGAGRGTFLWIDGGALAFAAWLAGEPNDAGGNEDCVEMDQAAGGWNDVPCDTPRSFICETATP